MNTLENGSAMGKLITFEGLDGCGKTTQLECLAEHLRTQGHNILVTRQPGGSEVGQSIRQIVLHHKGFVDPVAELMLYMADRAQHMAETILPAIKSGKTVLCDRHGDSTVAYQGYGRGLDVAMIKELNRIACKGHVPSQTFLFDGPVDVLKARVSQRGEADRLEREALDFHNRVREGFLALAKAEPERFTVFDATQTIETLTEQVHQAVSPKN